MEDISNIERSLEISRRALANRIQSIRSDFARGRAHDFAEQVSERENDDVLAGIETEAERELAQIEHALAKIKAGTYGDCDNCGKPIDSHRLKALPATSHCIQCASK